MRMLLISSLLFTVSCAQVKDFFNSGKASLSEKTAKEAQAGAKKHLQCKTGDAVYADAKKKMDELLKVKSESSTQKSVLGTVCTLSVGPLLEEAIDLGNKKLPESWQEDGCSLSGFQGDLEELAKKLCEKI